MKVRSNLWRFLGGLFVAVLVAGCAVPGGAPMMTSPESSGGVSAASQGFRRKTQPEPGIATGWGRELSSTILYSDFKRADDQPLKVASLYYNNAEFAEQAGVSRFRRRGIQELDGGLVEWGITGTWGSFPNYLWNGKRFVVGKKGRSYQLKIKNLSDARLEAVVSVDGLDVMDGKPASLKKRGYLINPGETLRVKGFRVSEAEVASFKFSSVSTSYRNLKHGETRNVGVVGLALFAEKGREPWSNREKRAAASPFAEAP